jgi:acyl-CoA thioesterase-1
MSLSNKRLAARRRFLRELAGAIPAVFGLASIVRAETPKNGSNGVNGRNVRIIALGDSLTAGYMLPADAGFTAVLQQALRRDGYDVTIGNAGVSGDTAEDGLARIDWALADGADGVILELGANDMLRGLKPEVTRHSLEAIMDRLAQLKIKVLIAGMRASPSLGEDYKQAFDRIYPELAAKYKAPLYPFFLQGVATDKSLTLADGLHPNAAGVKKIVAGILPTVESFIHTMVAGR